MGSSVGHRFGGAGKTVGGVKPTLTSSTIYNQEDSKTDSPVSATRNIYGFHRKDTSGSKNKESPLAKLKQVIDNPKVSAYTRKDTGTDKNPEATPGQSK